MTPSAQAEEQPPAQSSAEGRAMAEPDGLLHVWEHPFAGAGGAHCTWAGKANNWGVCKNKGSDIWNNGKPEAHDDVWLHWDVNNTGAFVCIGRGTSWSNLTRQDPPPANAQRITFWANTGAGSGQPIADNVASSEWGSC